MGSDPHPLFMYNLQVLQTYKIAATFLTCWLVLLVDGIEFHLSPWGLVSGLFMVPGGTAGYYGVQNAGLATAQGIWCSLKVIVSFVWGLLIFHEPVRSNRVTIASIGFMIVGLVGMSYFSSQESASEPQEEENPDIIDALLDDETTKLMQQRAPLLKKQTSYDGDETTLATSISTATLSLAEESSKDMESLKSSVDEGLIQFESPEMSGDPLRLRTTATSPTRINEEEGEEPPLIRHFSSSLSDQSDSNEKPRPSRLWGILGATIDGAYGGSVLVPMHYASLGGNSRTQGLGYLISFAVGCSAVVTMVWLLRLASYSIQAKSLKQGWANLPSMHFATVGPYASLAGFIWSIGNVSSILSVAYLGQGLGYSIIQSQLLIAGLWGVFFYREISPNFITKWFLSAFVTLIGILLLSRQHISLDDGQSEDDDGLVDSEYYQ
mmetsp:Transcript_26892/g.63023  ORF Transcript_26892/g.63023 Transcript_26892/m.63023 type:complete len:437 (-) Transcript_26892:108-1418(-)